MVQGEQTSRESLALNKSIEYIFKNKEFFLIIAITLLGVMLRVLAANNLEPNADEMVHGPHAKGIVEAGVIGRVWQSITWSYLTDIAYSVGEVTMLMARSTSIIFGVASIILMYLIGRQLYSKKVSILAALLLALSSFHIISTQIEMDIATAFFVLFAAFCFIKRLQKDGHFSYLAAIFIGVAALIKTLALFFVPAFVLFYFIYHKKWYDKELIKRTLIFIAIIVFMFSPILIHNYLWYTDKHLVDAYLAQYFDIGTSREAYAGIQGISNGFKFHELLTGSWQMLGDLFRLDPLLLIFGILGLILSAYKKERFALFFIFFQLFAFIGITATNRLQTHYAVLPPIFALYTAWCIITSIQTYCMNKNARKILFGALIVYISISSFILVQHIGSGTAITKMREFAIDQIQDNAVVVADARIYRGRIMWMFIDKHYLESSLFSEMVNLNQQTNGPSQTYKIWFIECVPDDCGWGTIKDQPEFNASTESLFSLVKEKATFVNEITGGGSPLIVSGTPYFRIYEAQIDLKPGMLSAIDNTHSFFYYPANYKPLELVFDTYKVEGTFNTLLYTLAKVLIWASIIISFASLLLLMYLLKKTSNHD